MVEALLLKPQEAFRRIGGGRDAGYALIRGGRIRVVRLGERRILVPASECEAFIEREAS